MGAITGIRVHETVPDTVLDEADEVVLVDTTPDELHARLVAGKVYLPRHGDNVAERAAQNFFRKGNLIALREIALRRTAEHVEDDMRSWRVEQSGSAAQPVGAGSGAILACVGPGEGAAQTVRTAARLAGQLNLRWYAAYVETPRLQRLPAARRDAVLATLKLAEGLGAETAVLTGQDIARALADHALQRSCGTVVVGRAAPGAGRWPGRQGMGERMVQHAPGMDIVVVAPAASARRLGAVAPGLQREARDVGADGRPAAWHGYTWAALASAAVTLLLLPLLDALEPVNIVMLFLLAVAGVALRFGRGPAALSALLNVAAFDYVFVTPRMSFAVSDVQYLLTFGVMLAVGLVIGQLTAGLRFSASVSASRERRAHSLFVLSRDLSAALESGQVVALGTAAVQTHFGGQAVVLAMDAFDRLPLPEPAPAGFDAGVADWAFRHNQGAGLATATLSAQTWHYIPLKAPMRVRGVLALQPAHPHWLLVPEQMQQLETLARQIAIALERVHYVEVAQQAVLDVESERLRNTLLGAISHDVRTPLTALIGLAEALQTLPPTEHAETARAIVAQARALHALVNNLLDMARLESGLPGGAVDLRRDWQSIEEVVGAAIRAAGPALQGMAVQTDLAPDLPLVELDAVLLERVLVNLLENAAKYGAAPVQVSARAVPGAMELVVRDHGPGLPAAMRGQEQRLFDKFTRGDPESATPGMGLGLAICKAIVQAHGGEITATHAAAGGGAEFRVSLPRRSPPPLPEPGQE